MREQFRDAEIAEITFAVGAIRIVALLVFPRRVGPAPLSKLDRQLGGVQ